MRRLSLYAVAVIVGGFAALLAWVVKDARFAFILLGLVLVAGLAWAARRFPEVRRVHLLGAAAATFLGALALAILLPSTRVPCDCPPPPGTIAGFACNCQMDHHVHLRFAIAVAGAFGAWLLFVAGNRRAERAVLNAH